MAERKINWTRRALLDRISIMEYWYNKIGSADYPVKIENLFSNTLALIAKNPRIDPFFY